MPWASWTQARPPGQSVALSHVAVQSASGASEGCEAGGGAAASAGRRKSSRRASVRTITASLAHAMSPLTVMPARNSTPSHAIRTGPPLSPVQLIAGAGDARKEAGRTSVIVVTPWRRRPGCAAALRVSP